MAEHPQEFHLCLSVPLEGCARNADLCDAVAASTSLFRLSLNLRVRGARMGAMLWNFSILQSSSMSQDSYVLEKLPPHGYSVSGSA